MFNQFKRGTKLKCGRDGTVSKGKINGKKKRAGMVVPHLDTHYTY